MNKKTKIAVFSVIGLLVVVGIMALLYNVFSKKQENPGASKTITVTVTHKDGTVKDFTIPTDADYLRGALEQVEGLIAGSESEYGLFVTEVDGEIADYNTDGSFWGFYLGEAFCEYGVDTMPINDQDHFYITYTVY